MAFQNRPCRATLYSLGCHCHVLVESLTGEDRGVGDLGVKGAGVGGFWRKMGGGQMGGGKKSEFWVGYPKKKKKGKKWGRGREEKNGWG